MNIIQAIESSKVFKPLFKDLKSWKAWLVFLKSLFALPMERDERRLFKKCTGLKKAPTMQAREAYVIAGRRSGKSFISSIIAVFLALFHDWKPYLSPGEKGWIFIIATDRAQAKIIKNYVSGILASSPLFRKAVKRELRDEIELQNNIIISIKTCDFRSIRGYTVVAAICEELAFWKDEQSVNPAQEVLVALKPALATVVGSLLIGISTPYSRSGVLWDMYREREERGAPLVWQAPTQTMNPTISKKLIDDALKEDKSAAQAEWLARFRTDVESFLPLDLIEIAVLENRLELPKLESVRYFAHADSSGGRQDSFTLAVAHKAERRGRIILDLLREKKPPFKPSLVVEEFSQILKEYEVSQIVCDNYAGEWVTSSFRDHGIMVENSKLSASEIYLAALPLFSNSSVELLDSQRLVSQLRGLERRTRAGGKDLITHYPGGHDDLANAACGAIVRVHANASIILDEPPSLGLSEEVMTEEEKIKSEFDDEMLGKKKKVEDEDSFDENEWDLTNLSAVDIGRECDRIEGKKGKEPLVKFFKKWS